MIGGNKFWERPQNKHFSTNPMFNIALNWYSTWARISLSMFMLPAPRLSAIYSISLSPLSFSTSCSNRTHVCLIAWGFHLPSSAALFLLCRWHINIATLYCISNSPNHEYYRESNVNPLRWWRIHEQILPISHGLEASWTEIVGASCSWSMLSDVNELQN